MLLRGFGSDDTSGSQELLVKKEVDDTPAEDVGGPGHDRCGTGDDPIRSVAQDEDLDFRGFLNH